MKHLILALLLTTATAHATTVTLFHGQGGSCAVADASRWEEAIDCDRDHYDDSEGVPQECEPVENACDADEAD